METRSTFSIFVRDLFHESIHYAQNFGGKGIDFNSSYAANFQEAEAYYRTFKNTSLLNYDNQEQVNHAARWAKFHASAALVNGASSSVDVSKLKSWIKYFESLIK